MKKIIPFAFDPVTHEYRSNGRRIPSVTGILRAAGIADLHFANSDALERGSEVHKCIENVERGRDPGMTPAEYVSYVVGWLKFKRDTGYKSRLIESHVFHPVYFYGGTLDTFGEMARPRCSALIDVKTGSCAWWTAIQLAGYEMALREKLGKRFTAKIARFAVQLPGDGSYKLHEYSDRSDFAVFAAALTVRNRLARENILEEKES